MKKIISILILILISISGFSQRITRERNEAIADSLIKVSRIKAKIEDSNRVVTIHKNIEKTASNVDTIRQCVDSIGKIFKKEVKRYGWKKTVRINSPILLPLALFIILFLLWLKNRKNDN